MLTWFFCGGYLSHFSSSPQYFCCLSNLDILINHHSRKGVGIPDLVKMLLEFKLHGVKKSPHKCITITCFLQRRAHKDIAYKEFCCSQLKNKLLASAGEQRENLLMCSHERSWDFSWINLYRKGDPNTVSEFSQVEVLYPKWWGRERARLKGIVAIAQCQGTAEWWPVVAGVEKRQINFWSPWESL